jgi:hypothetical protein
MAGRASLDDLDRGVVELSVDDLLGDLPVLRSDDEDPPSDGGEPAEGVQAPGRQ